MDGVSLLTQCPVTYRSSFTYRFKALDAGTHYWHGHTGMQRADGLFGAIVVRQPPSHEPHLTLYDHDLSEHVILVHDWTKRSTLPSYLAHHHNDGSNAPELMLINGMGAHEEFKDGNSTIYTPRASFTVEGGKRYRFRVISNAIGECPIQRVNPWNGATSNKDIEITRMRSELADGNDGVLTSDPDKKFYLGMLFNQVNSLKYNNPDFYPLSVVVSNKRVFSPQINFISSNLPDSPPLSQYDDVPASSYCNELTVQTDCHREWCSCTHKLDVSLGDLVELVVIDQGLPWESSHPVHIHGFKFRAVAMGKLGTSASFQAVKDLDRVGNITRSTSRAPYKDSITVPDGGYVVLRFRADNPGMWLFHCHVEAHADIGMGVIIQVGEKSEFPKTPKNFPKCGSWNYEADDDDDDDDDNDDAHKNQPILVQCLNPPNSAVTQTGLVTGLLVALVASSGV
ncbi:multicopper oxidase [Elysia marginata]|uniref:Multicopper oxidase n=1 Tax=Elysia marginata TaxID=1093978 RepID=A0AAV4ERA2_9GAST|nr:multicopper oxidase [Elysia marginata]